MITQIELDGFKTFKDFKVELAPFQVIVGPNGSGKSNLFDALRLLSRLAKMDVLSAFQGSRGEDDELFTVLSEGKTVDQMRIAVELLVERKVQDDLATALLSPVSPIDEVLTERKIQDDLGGKGELKYTRLRYEVEVVLRTDQYGLERPYLTHESLKAIPREKDFWSNKYHLALHNGWLPATTGNEVTCIDTGRFIKSVDGVDTVDAKTPVITLYRDDQTKGNPIQYRANDLQRTLLSTVTSVEYLHAFAVRKEFLSLRFLHLSQEALRKPGSLKGPRLLAEDGSNLPTTLARIQTEDPFAFHCIAIDLGSLVPDTLDVRVVKNIASNEYDIWVDMADGRSFPAQVLSDGTLRLLALATLRNDPQFHGTLCIEEPENGVQPLYMKKMACLLREMATNFNNAEQGNEPFKQVLVATHSPLFASQPEVIDTLLLALVPTSMHSKTLPPLRVTRMVPVIIPNTLFNISTDGERNRAIEAYTIDIAKHYLSHETLDEAISQLNEARTQLNER